MIDIPDVVTGGADAQNDGGAGDVVTPPKCEAGACGAPAGFSPVLFDPSGSNTCPSGTLAVDEIASVVSVPAGACPCTCAVTTPPTCAPATVPAHFDNAATPTCNNNINLPLTGGCDSTGIPLPAHAAFDPVPPADAGACTATSGAPDTNAVVVTKARLCVDAQCANPVTCAPTNSFKACVMQSGDVPCPNGLVAHPLGASVSLQCSACTTCTMTTGSCGGTVSYYSDSACNNLVGSYPVDGTCFTQPGAGQPTSSKRWVPVIDAGCVGATSDGGTASLGSPLTVCCPP